MWIRWISVLFDKTLVLYYDKWSGFRPFLHFTLFHVVGYVYIENEQISQITKKKEFIHEFFRSEFQPDNFR